MNTIIDVQGFKISEKEFIPKELAAFDGSKFTHFIFKPPYSFHHLPEPMKKQASWLIDHHHSINWDEGFTPIYQFKNIIIRLTKSADRIYVKGREKSNFLRKFTTKIITELDEHPAMQESEPKCFYHNKPKCICALSNVILLYEKFIMK